MDDVPMIHDPIRVHSGSLDWARQMLTLQMLDERQMLDDEIHKLCTFPLTAAPSVIRALVEALAATWDSLEDFSAHVIAADAANDDGGDHRG